MSTAFYKSSDSALLVAWPTYEAQARAVSTAGQAFAAHFGGQLLTRSDLHGRSVAGLCFVPAKDDLLWTKPDQQAAARQKPRATLRRGTKDQRQALAELQDEWKVHFPCEKADLAPVLSAMGTDRGNLFFCGFPLVMHDNAIYVSTDAKLAPRMVEILASQYNAARAAYESMKEAA